MTTPATARRRGVSSPPKFVTGSLLRHILVMTGTGAVGLMAIFLGDLANVLFLSMLGDETLVAAVGYASSILFLTVSIGIGLMIAATTLVSTALGAGRREDARRLSANAHLATFLVSSVLAVMVFLAVPWLLRWLGATGRTLDLATDYLWILVPTLPLLALGMTSSGVLRAVGDARRAMYVTLIAALVNIALDPLFIFVFDLGLHGAALASVVSRFAVMGIGFYGVIYVHDLMGRPRLQTFLADAPQLAHLAIPAVLTNIATPAANAYVTAAVSPFGDSAMAGWAVIGRIMPVAFGAVYALSGAIGPILGQNLGAGEYGRLERAFWLSLVVTGVFTAVAWGVLALSAEPLAALFHAKGEAAALIIVFCRWLAPLFVFLGALFVANAAFNTLGRPRLSAGLNWTRATLGTVPFVMVGAMLDGARGVMTGNMLGGVVFGVLAVWLCHRHIAALSRAAEARAVAPLSPEEVMRA